MRTVLSFALFWSLAGFTAFGEQRFIVRTTLGSTTLSAACALLGCNVASPLGDPAGQTFLLTMPDVLNAGIVLGALRLNAGLLSFEPDQIVRVADNPPLPNALFQTDVVAWFGGLARYGFVAQPSASIVRIIAAQQDFGVTGTGIVGVIDTGVDPDHPVLRSSLLPGYDFLRNTEGSADEKGDVTQSTTGVVDNGPPFFVSGTIAALLDPLTALLIGNKSAFGHGTMVAGIVHLTAPGAQILPLKAFKPDGTGYTSDVIRAIYYAVRRGARVLNMSFTFPSSSPELQRAVSYASSMKTICVAAAGNDNSAARRYPAAFSNVISVASTSDLDNRSSFSNYGSDWVWVAAPGEGIVTTYPFGTFSAGWGTSFSAPFVAGTVALLLQTAPDLTFTTAASAIAQAQPVSGDLGHGRLDVYRSVNSTFVAR